MICSSDCEIDIDPRFLGLMEIVVQVLEAGGKLTGDCSFLFRCLAAVMTTSRTKPSQVQPIIEPGISISYFSVLSR
jgi:hypothetical protein